MSVSPSFVAPPDLAALSLGFRNAYLDDARLTAQLQAWANAFPELTRLRALGTTPEGRTIWLLVIGREPDRRRPAVWVDGNMHAAEVAGSSVALAIAEDVLALHLGAVPHDLSAAARARVEDVLFYIVPRISPDGAEMVLRTGQSVRSVPRDERCDRGPARWLPQDIDGDGQVRTMRVVDPGGELVASRDVPGLLVARTIDDAGPFYKVYPEGVIVNFDGHHVPSPHFLGHAPIDLNRNFPWFWAPAHEQVGAGPYPASEPEARAIVAFVSAHPEIVAWMNLHTFGGVVIRPLGHAPDSKMQQEDLAMYRQLAAWMQTYTGYPTVNGHDEFLYEPDKPLRGDLSDFAYHQRGAFAYVVELWDIFARLGKPKPPKFVAYYEEFSAADLHALAAWDATHNQQRIFTPWRPAQHPQLGAVEIGGVDPRIGLWNPSLAELPNVCAGQSAAFLRVAALAPALHVETLTIRTLANDTFAATVAVSNLGYWGTYGIPSAKALDWNEPLHVTIAAEACTQVLPASSHLQLGHLEGWGRGLDVGQHLPAYPGTRGTTHRTVLELVWQGRGTLHLRIGSARMGFIDHQVKAP